jgi:hypothetical protein
MALLRGSRMSAERRNQHAHPACPPRLAAADRGVEGRTPISRQRCPNATFITESVKAGGVSVKKLADYCGTSMAMIDAHYSALLEPETADELAVLGGTTKRVATIAEAC